MSNLRLINNEWILDDIPDADKLGWETVDIGDGSWTQSDPSGIILNTAATTNEITKIDFNAVGTGNLDYDPSTGTNFTGPRWYSKLQTTDGVRINTDDPFIINYELVVEAPNTKDKVNILIGIAEDPTSTVLGTINFVGQMLEYATTSANPSIGPYVAGGSPVLGTNVNNKIGFSSFATITNRIGNISAFNLDSSSAFILERSTTSSKTFTSSTDMFLVVQAGLNGTSTIGACDIQAKLRYRVIRLSGFPI